MAADGPYTHAPAGQAGPSKADAGEEASRDEASRWEEPGGGKHGDGGWHSEVLAGSSWFAQQPADGGTQRARKGRESDARFDGGSDGGFGGRSKKRGRRSRSGRREVEGGRDRGSKPEGPDADSPAGAGPDADPESVARAICLRLLTMAPKTRAQLAEALRKRDVPAEAAEAVLSRFSELGLINDEAFAAAWVDSRHHGRGLARRALAAELRHRGVDNDTVKEAVERLDPDQEAETARRLVDRKLAATRSLDPQTRTRRLAGMLARKGYSSGVAYRVIREALEEEGIDLEADFP
ncbi:recombination regulator RecX [Nonomuraea sp. NBC_00507]